MLQTDKDLVEIASMRGLTSIKFTKILSRLHMIVIWIVYTEQKMKGENDDENKTK